MAHTLACHLCLSRQSCSYRSPQTLSAYTPRFFSPEGAAESLGELYRAGWDVNCQDDAGVTPTHLAARNGHKRCLRLLVEHYGADVTVADYEGFTSV